MPWSLEVIEHNRRPVLETHYRGVMPPQELADAVRAILDHLDDGAEHLLGELLTGPGAALLVRADLFAAIAEFQRRERRFGAI